MERNYIVFCRCTSVVVRGLVTTPDQATAAAACQRPSEPAAKSSAGRRSDWVNSAGMLILQEYPRSTNSSLHAFSSVLSRSCFCRMCHRRISVIPIPQPGNRGSQNGSQGGQPPSGTSQGTLCTDDFSLLCCTCGVKSSCSRYAAGIPNRGPMNRP